MGATAAIVGAFASVAGTVTQMQASRQARKDQQQALKVQNKQAQIANQRQIQQRAAAARIQNAEYASQAFASGAPAASGGLGAIGGNTMDYASSVGYNSTQAGLETARVGFLNDAAAAQTRGTQWGAAFSTIGQVAGMFQPKA